MKQALVHITFSFAIICCCSCKQSPEQVRTPAEKFLNFLNTYQSDSLRSLLADNFRFHRGYINTSYDKQTFLDKYVSRSKDLHAGFKVVQTSSKDNITSFWVEDQSDYLKYLDIPTYTWVLSIETDQQQKITGMLIDTTEGYTKYNAAALEKGDKFRQWLNEKYPEDSTEIIQNTEGLLTKRLMEYSNSK